MDTTDSLNNDKLTENERTKIKQDATIAQAKAEVELQQQILELKRKGVDDLSQLSGNELNDYKEQLQNKLSTRR